MANGTRSTLRPRGALAGGSRGGLLAASFFRSDGDFAYRFDPTPQLAGTPLQSATRSNDQSLSAGAIGNGFFRIGRAELELVGQGSAGARGSPARSTNHAERLGELAARAGRRPAADTQPDRPREPGAAGARPGRCARREPRVRGCRAPARSGHRPHRDLRAAPGAGAAAGVVAGCRSRVARGRRLRQSGPDGLLGRGLGRGLALDGPAAAGAGGPLRCAGSLQRLQPEARARAAAVEAAGDSRQRRGSFRAPTFAELYLQQGLLQPNPGLVPEYGQTADVGVALSGWRTLVSVDVFASSYQDLIVYEVDPPSA
jgi:vitamin B12 transporter